MSSEVSPACSRSFLFFIDDDLPRRVKCDRPDEASDCVSCVKRVRGLLSDPLATVGPRSTGFRVFARLQHGKLYAIAAGRSV